MFRGLAKRYRFPPDVVANMSLAQIAEYCVVDEEDEADSETPDPHAGKGQPMTPEQVMVLIERRRRELEAGVNLRED